MPYVGSDVLGSAVCMDKLTLKRLLAAHGIPQVEFTAVAGQRLVGALRAARAAALGQALAARLERRHHPGRADRGPRRGGRAGAAPRPAGDRRGLRPRPRGRVLGARQRGAARPRCRARSSPTPSGTTSRPSTPRAAWSCGCRRRSARRRPTGCASWPPRSSPSPAAPASPAATSSSSPPARCWSTRSTRCPASPRPASTRSCSRPSGVPYPELCDRLVGLGVERHQRERAHEF